MRTLPSFSTLRVTSLSLMASVLLMVGCSSAPVKTPEAPQTTPEAPAIVEAPKPLPATSPQLLATRAILTADIIEGAIVLYRTLEGSLPQSLEELVPNYLFEIPRLPIEIEHPAYPEWLYLPGLRGASLTIFLNPHAEEVAKRINTTLGLPEGPFPVEQTVIHPNFKGRAVIATPQGLFFYVALQ